MIANAGGAAPDPVAADDDGDDGDDVVMDPNAAEAAAGSQPSQAASHASDEDHGVLEVDYEPDSGMDDEELAQYYPPMLNGQPYIPYYDDDGLDLEHAHTPPYFLPALENVLPAGYDYHHLGIHQALPDWYEQPQHHQHHQHEQ